MAVAKEARRDTLAREELRVAPPVHQSGEQASQLFNSWRLLFCRYCCCCCCCCCWVLVTNHQAFSITSVYLPYGRSPHRCRFLIARRRERRGVASRDVVVVTTWSEAKYEAFCSVAAEGKAVAQSSNGGFFPMGAATATAAGHLELTTNLSTFYHLGGVVAIWWVSRQLSVSGCVTTTTSRHQQRL
jgi:hypothetical protein